jgi:hypothetical protein
LRNRSPSSAATVKDSAIVFVAALRLGSENLTATA